MGAEGEARGGWLIVVTLKPPALVLADRLAAGVLGNDCGFAASLGLAAPLDNLWLRLRLDTPGDRISRR